MSWGPILGYSRAERVGRRKYIGVRGFWAETGNTQSMLTENFGDYYPGITGPYRPICTKIEVREHGLSATKDLVLRYYETPRIVGKGTLYWRPSQMRRTRKMEKLDPPKIPQQITGVDRETGDRYQIVEGPGAFPQTNGTFVLQTAHYPNDPFLHRMLGWRDKINSNPMRNFLSTPPYTLRYVTAKVTPEGPDGLVYADHLFKYNPQGWNNWVKVQRETWKVEAVPVLDGEGNVATDDDGNVITKAKGRWVPAQRVVGIKHESYDEYGNPVRTYEYEDEDPSPRTLYRSMNMTIFDSMVEW